MARAERVMSEGDELQSGSNMGKGQMKAADFILNPMVQIVEANAGGFGGGAVGGILGRSAPMIGVIVGGVKFKDAETNIEIIDARTSVQVAATQGKARRASFSVGALGALGLGGAVGGYSNTNEGKLVAASFVSNFNNIVRELRSNASLMASAATVTKTSGRDVVAGPTINNGDVMSPKIHGVRVMVEPTDASKVMHVLSASDNVVSLGRTTNEYLEVVTPLGKGWVLLALVERRR